jgi:surface polysaccharide O-acyltransferase-like enzyme
VTYVKWTDDIKLLATFLVILLHVSSFYIINSELFSYNWWVANFFESISRFCVPVFFIVSGFLTFNSNCEIGLSFLKRKVSRILLPFIFWSAFYMGFSFLKIIYLGKEIDPVFFLNELVLYGSYYHLWFLYSMIVIFLIAPFIKKVIIYNSNLALFISVLFILIINILEVYFTASKNYSLQSLPVLILSFLYLPYFILGGLISYSYFNCLSKQVGVLLFSLGVIITFVLASLFGISYSYFYLSLPVFLTSISAVSLFSQQYVVIDVGFFSLISKYLFGIYLVHPFVLDLIYFFNKLFSSYISLNFNVVFYIPLLTLIVFCLSFLICFVFSYSNYFRRTIGI